MRESDQDHSSRRLRLTEWFILLLLFGLVAGVRAESVYKCTDAQGAVAFQSTACGDGRQETLVAIAPAPAPTASPEYAIDSSKPARAVGSHRSTVGSRASSTDAASYECRASDGQIFYRHSACPRSIASSKDGKAKRRGQAVTKSLSVSSTRVSREEACTQMRRAGAIGRNGHEHDQDVSTYDKNLGRDPCR